MRTVAGSRGATVRPDPRVDPEVAARWASFGEEDGRVPTPVAVPRVAVLVEPVLVERASVEVAAPVVVPPPVRRVSSPTQRTVGAALSILAALLLGFVAEVVLLGGVRHARDQRVAFADLRKDLANATAPVGQVDGNGAVNALGRPLAILAVPSLGIREVVLEGTTARVLQSGPGHRRDTVLPGQPGTSVVMGRQAAYGGPFGGLADLKPGKLIVVTTGQGKHTYRSTGVRRAGDPQPQPLAAGKGRLTLVTATGPAFMPTDVLRVDADLVSEPAPVAVRMLGPASLSATEQAMAGDPSAWVPALLLAQGLLLAAVALAWALVHWGRWQTWVVGLPLTAAIGIALAGQIALLLPNLL